MIGCFELENECVMIEWSGAAGARGGHQLMYLTDILQEGAAFAIRT
jgi:hypothetical protein